MQHRFSTHVAAMLQNKLPVVVARFTEALLLDSGKLSTHPSPNQTFYRKLKISVNVRLGGIGEQFSTLTPVL